MSEPLPMDIRVDRWTFETKRAFHKAVGDNASYARLCIERAFNAAIAGQVEGRSDAHDAILNLDLDWLAGFVWIAQRERDPNRTYEQTLAELSEREDAEEALLEALYARIGEEIEERAQPAPFEENSAPKAKTSRRSATGSASSSSSAAGSVSETSSA